MQKSKDEAAKVDDKTVQKTKKDEVRTGEDVRKSGTKSL